jgi:hypothetical protein
MRTAFAAASLVLLGLAGCSDPPAAEPDDVILLPDGTEVAAGTLLNYTTLHPGGEPFTRHYEGTLTPQEAAQSTSVPFGVSAPTFETCCSWDMVQVDDLLVADQLLALRVTLTWTNTQNDRAGLDAATCLPWACYAFNRGADESQEPGLHTDVLTLITSGRTEFAEMGMTPQVGVRYTNAIMASGMPYTIDVEAFPVGNGLAAVDPYVLEVADNATVTAELLGPFAEDGISAGFLVYDRSDRPVQWIEVSGPHGSRHNLTLPGGQYVIIPMTVSGGFPRLSTDLPPGKLKMERLQEEFTQVEFAEVADAQEHAGTYDFMAEPGTIDPFPVFLYADGASAQDLFGLSPSEVGASRSVLRSSSGTIAEVVQQQLSIQETMVLGQQSCLNCNFFVPGYSAQNYVDDDGTYQVEWSSKGAAGTFVLFTAKYIR